MTRIDHAARSRSRMEKVLSNYETGEDAGAIVVALAALNDATLALIEQRRIANLIALATGQHTFEGIARRASAVAHDALVTDPNGDLDPDIAAALGIKP